MSVRVLHADARDALKDMADASIDACVTDPPYALVSITKRFGADNAAPAAGGVYARSSAGFMGKKWDTGETAFAPEFWAEVLRVLKPGAHLIAFGGTRTYHRLVCAIEDAGFEVRDQLAWLFGSGFPKSHDVSKGIDRAVGAEREVIGVREYAGGHVQRSSADKLAPPIGTFVRTQDERLESAPATDAARQWQGWGTALKPAHEPICLARKPLASPPIDVRGMIEMQLRERGVEGEIVWSRSGASAAEKSKTLRTLSSTAARKTAETFADHADGSETLNGERPIAKHSEARGISGQQATGSVRESTAEPLTANLGPKCSPPTAGDVPAAERQSSDSSLSITLTGAARRTGKASTAKSMANSAAKDSRPDTECFAGIATGLTGSTERVLINRRSDGSFAWPEGVPEFVPSRPLTVAANVLQHGTGALNIDASRIPTEEGWQDYVKATARPNSAGQMHVGKVMNRPGTPTVNPSPLGRWPANCIHDGSEEVLRHFPESDGAVSNGKQSGTGFRGNFGAMQQTPSFGDSGSAARFFYTAKADADDRLGSKHPTVKPVDLMAYLVKLVTPPGGIVLDPFAGSGTTGMACMREGFDCIMIEREAEYVADINRRIAHVRGEDAPLFAEVSL